jgi:hypothetical protein
VIEGVQVILEILEYLEIEVIREIPETLVLQGEETLEILEIEQIL